METITLICGIVLYVYILICMISYKHFQASLDSWNAILETTIQSVSDGDTENWFYYKSKTGNGSLAWRSYSLWKKAVFNL